MIKWWLAMIIGAVTLCVGYTFGRRRMMHLLKMAEELADRSSELYERTQDLLRIIEDEQQK